MFVGNATIFSSNLLDLNGKFAFFAGSASETAAGNCTAGYFCTGGSPVPNQNATEPGHFSPEGSYDQTPCRPGFYQPARQSPSCLVCPEGFYCNGTGTVNAIICPPSSFCEMGSEIPEPCPPGVWLGLHLWCFPCFVFQT